MYSHNMIGTNDIAKSKDFYDAVFGAIGGPQGVTDPKGRVIYAFRDSLFMITQPIDGQPATVANGNTIGFQMDSTDECDVWHTAGTQAGGTAIENPPGIRETNGRKIYLAYLRDPDGHKLCALHFPKEGE